MTLAVGKDLDNNAANIGSQVADLRPDSGNHLVGTGAGVAPRVEHESGIGSAYSQECSEFRETGSS